MKSNELIMISTPKGKSTFMEIFEQVRQFAKERDVVIITPKAPKIQGNEYDRVTWDDIMEDRTVGMSKSFEALYGPDQIIAIEMSQKEVNDRMDMLLTKERSGLGSDAVMLGGRRGAGMSINNNMKMLAATLSVTDLSRYDTEEYQAAPPKNKPWYSKHRKSKW